MVWNIIDKRSRPYRWRKINAVIENIEHDNSVQDTDLFEDKSADAPVYDGRKSILLHDAVAWAETQAGKVTLYLYDEGGGI